jgi:hypothetical protein
MKLSDRIDAFVALGDRLHTIEVTGKDTLYRNAANTNSWFTPQQCDLAFKGISKFLVKESLTQWTSSYDLIPKNPRNVGVVMAGNIPMVGFHDLLTVLISGHKLSAKLSSQDSVLMRYVADQLLQVEPRFGEFLSFEERMNHVDAVIATGSDNTSRYFEYYFRKKPHIIRKNRSSLAVIRGNENPDDMLALGSDVFSYFGLGCRNVSKLVVPEGYDFTPLLRTWEQFQDVVNNHHKYVNNYDYNKSILLVNGVTFLDNLSVLITANTAFVSPISVIYFETWKSEEDIVNMINGVSEKLQCVASAGGWFKGSVPFGTTQEPGLTDYADGVDTLKFLSSLN